MYTGRRSPCVLRWIAVWVFILAFVSPAQIVSNRFAADFPVTSPPAGVVVIGFVGGFVRNNDAVHQEVQVFTHLRDEHPAGMQARIFGNHDGRRAHQAVLQLLGANPSGVLSEEGKRAAHIVLYGHSWGASEAVTLARTLERDGIPVLLTIQVDSVSKFGENDKLIPANVAQAVNFYQLNGLLHGQRQIKAVDGLRTKILGNFRFDYATKPVNTDGYPWYARVFMKPHIEIESDPRVWNQVESLIRSNLLPTVESPH
jgi:hypothetical protein